MKYQLLNIAPIEEWEQIILDDWNSVNLMNDVKEIYNVIKKIQQFISEWQLHIETTNKNLNKSFESEIILMLMGKTREHIINALKQIQYVIDEYTQMKQVLENKLNEINSM